MLSRQVHIELAIFHPIGRVIMAQSDLCLHAGGKEITFEELKQLQAPAATATYFPVAHAQVAETVQSSLASAGFGIAKARYAVSHEGARLFSILDLTTPLYSGVHLCVGIRNSHDRRFPLGFCAGSRVFVCDNLAMRAELLVKRKHTRFGETRFNEAICQAVQNLNEFKEVESNRIRRLSTTEISDEKAAAIMIRAFEQEIVSYRTLPRVIAEWRKPSFEEFSERTLWALFNAFTYAITERRLSPQQYALTTIQLNGLFDEPQLAQAT